MALRLSRRKLAHETARSIAAGDKLAIERLAAYLVEHRRTNEAELVIRAVEQALVDQGVIVADVVSARSLSDEAKRAIESQLKADTNATSVQLRTAVDGSLIGGMRLRYGDTLLDASVATKLERLV